MKNKKVKDERIIQVQNKILGEAYFVMVFLLFISVLVKAYVMKYDYTNYITELTIIILSAIYVAIRSIMTGNNLMDTSKRSKTLCVLGAFGASIIITAIIVGFTTTYRTKYQYPLKIVRYISSFHQRWLSFFSMMINK